MDADQRLRQEFNQWAEEGRGEEMERHHLPIANPVIALMDLKTGDRVLDLGCGSGWATRRMARLVDGPPEKAGQVIGIDVADEMVRRARAASRDFDNVMYIWGSAEQIPWEENSFNKVLSIESFYYYRDQDRVLNELFRVMAPQGRMFILINLYKDNPHSLAWIEKLNVPVHSRSEAEYIELFKSHAFEQVESRRVPDLSPTPEEYRGKWFKNAAELREFKRIGALLLMATKPDFRSMAPPYMIY